jgi:hypothetical protein
MPKIVRFILNFKIIKKKKKEIYKISKSNKFIKKKRKKEIYKNIKNKSIKKKRKKIYK